MSEKKINLNMCPECNEEVAIGSTGTIGCVNDDCETCVIGVIYKEPITFEDQLVFLTEINNKLPITNN